jgi:hypothetical protein
MTACWRTKRSRRGWIAERPIDFVLADVVLPGDSGGEDLAAEAPRSGARTLLMSGDYAALRKLEKPSASPSSSPGHMMR